MCPASAEPPWEARCPVSLFPGSQSPLQTNLSLFYLDMAVCLKLPRTTTVGPPPHRLTPLSDGWVDTSGALRAFPAALVSLVCGYEKPPPLVFRGCPTRQGDRRGEGGQSRGCRARHVLQPCPVSGLYDIAARNSSLGAVLN